MKCINENCTEERLCGRRYCRQCYLTRKIDQAKIWAAHHGFYKYKIECTACHRVYNAWKKHSLLCPECHNESRNTGFVQHDYVNAKGGGYCWLHRRLAEDILGRKLSSNEVVHHMDGDTKNKVLENLIVMPREWHGRLHQYLREQRIVSFKAIDSLIKNDEQWKLVVPSLSNIWLYANHVPIIRLGSF